MPFPPHEFEPSSSDFDETIKAYENEMHVLHLGTRTVNPYWFHNFLEQRPIKKLWEVRYNELFSTLTKECDRLGITPDTDVAHHFPKAAEDIWLVAIRDSAKDRLSEDLLRIVVNHSRGDPDNIDDRRVTLTEAVIDINKLSIGFNQGIWKRGHSHVAKQPPNGFPPAIDRDDFYDGKGVRLVVAKKHHSPSFYPFDGYRTSQQPTLLARLAELTSVMQELNSVTAEQVAPIQRTSDETH